MNIYKFELKLLIKSIIVWGISVPLALFAYMAFFPLIASSGEDFMAVMEMLPQEMLDVFGLIPELPVNEILGYFNLTFGMVQIPLAIQAANYGFNMLSVEERELTADFLLSKPVKRSKVYFSKLFASLTALTVINAILWIATISSLLIFKGDEVISLRPIYVLLSTIIFFQLFFVSVGMLISMLLKKIPSVLSFSMGLGFGMFILTSMGAIIGNGLFKLISPYSHFSPVHILVEGTYDFPLVIVSFVTIIISLGGSFFLYQRRNIPSL